MKTFKITTKEGIFEKCKNIEAESFNYDIIARVVNFRDNNGKIIAIFKLNYVKSILPVEK